MALLLSDIVISGWIDNSVRNSVHGLLNLRGFRQPLVLSLTGNCAEDLAGKYFSFEVPESSPLVGTDRTLLAQLTPRQIGPVGVITAIGRVQMDSYSAEELLDQLMGVVPPEKQWGQSLFLEWFGQNGHVVVELLDTRVRLFDSCGHEQQLDDTEDGLDMLPDPAVVDELLEQETLDEEDPYHLFPPGLSAEMETELNQVPCFDGRQRKHGPAGHGEQTPLQVLFDPPLKLYPAERLDDKQVEESLQVLLARLAREGIALDMCEHFSVRDAYCLLLEHILPRESVRLDWIRSGFVQHYSTHEFCPICLGNSSDDV